MPVTLQDPRSYQIAVLASLLLWGLLGLGLDQRPAAVAVLLGAALGTQVLCCGIRGLAVDLQSPLISGLSLCLLARSNSLALLAVTAALSIGSKFLLRVHGKHVFNPTNFGLVAMLLLSEGVWVSPGQWGSATFFAFLLVGAGGLVVYRARRSDVTWAFLLAHAGVLCGRALWLGDPWSIPLHQLESGALLIFAFFMISDPKTTPDSRAGRIVFAVLVAVSGGAIRVYLHNSLGLLWALAACAPLVPLLDWLLPAERYRWPQGAAPSGRRHLPEIVKRPQVGLKKGASVMSLSSTGLVHRIVRRLAAPLLLASAVLALPPAPARAFCGFYVARADAKLFNRASRVVLVRDGERTVMTLANDFQGEPREFAVVVPVPTFITEEQIHVADRALLDHLDAYTAPRLVEYHDPDPCFLYDREADLLRAHSEAPSGMPGRAGESNSLGVTIEARYTVGEYDILILSAEESSGLETWLRREGYRIPEGASQVLASYLRQKMRFFVARVNLNEQARLGYSYLRPLQVAYESPKFMLPIRLGTVNADGPQELFVYALTRRGRVETTNYRTVRLPTGMELPVFVKQEFPDFYRDMFARQVDQERMHAVFLEYAWDMAWCDPCAADPLSRAELQELGVFWLAADEGLRGGGAGAANVFVTRLHVRYDAASFPEDLVFQETADRDNFQGRYVLRNAWQGPSRCPAGEQYRRQLPLRHEEEARTLAQLTGWDLEEIRGRMELGGPAGGEEDSPWWKRLWPAR